MFLRLESIDPANLEGVNKSFNKPNEGAAILKNMADRGIYAITSFIFGMDGDTTGIADRTLQTMQSWPPGLPVFSPLTCSWRIPAHAAIGVWYNPRQCVCQR